ncbi:Uncharacterized protein dnl_57620 [Desulfonema limicola]|uniref:BREX system P-loop protein BrxC n=1 Tax=Desulfonema limicola TaxID=45656 RepID=A0A975BDP6_9BACT|nr:BREX system P-loop protein BrxC [Desulfonema limicola]QTA83360.1 Uncharacterized protein dnl_57620 [Desulfonema limicola]
MTKIYEILKLDLEEDIKSVIDLDVHTEIEVKNEIDSYIVTENIGKYFSDFASRFTSNIKETGVWISGFYGSGKSYFGKMLGYVLENREIMGTPAADRFIARLTGLKNASLIENEIRRLTLMNTRVVMLDIAKQDTANGLAFTLFRNFLKSLGYLDNVYGYMEYNMFLDRRYDDFLELVKEMNNGSEWPDLKKSKMKTPAAIKKALTMKWYSEDEYNEMLALLNNTIKEFSAERLKEELERYLKNNDETLVFIFDEASEAISQEKYNLLDLEGLSEAMSGIRSKVWTIAIAQEKLDDVINKSNISKGQLVKVTDRFKTKINLESTEVDIIIKNRLLLKKDKFYNSIKDYYKANEGIISDAVNLKSRFPAKIENADECAVYYPFHKYQFTLLQRFLFSSNALAATQAAARGMIITIFDVLRNPLKNMELFQFAPAFYICEQAQTAPPSVLVNKYDIAKKILKNQGSAIDGRQLLKTIHFLTESDLVSATSESIAKAYIQDVETYYTIKPVVDDALNILTESRILLFSNNTYKITSDLETKLLDEMKDFSVDLFIKKSNLIRNLKKLKNLKSISVFSDLGIQYHFNVLSDSDDELFSSSNKSLQIRLYNLYSVSGSKNDREEVIETVKLDTQFEKTRITIIPQTSDYSKIDDLIEEVQKFEYMLEKYGSDSDAQIKQIIRDFSIIRDEKEKALKLLIEKAYTWADAVYLFDTIILNDKNFSSAVSSLQKKVIKNVYTKRPSIQLSEKLAIEIVKEKSDKKLSRFNNGDDFNFFDDNGNFVGEGLKVTEEVVSLINYNSADGKTLESELLKPPTGYEYGTVATVLAALFRAGRVTIRFKGNDYFSYRDQGAAEIFSTGKNFQKSSFKALTRTLNAAQKNIMVQALLDMNYKEITGEAVDWNTNDFQLTDSIRVLAERFITSIDTLEKSVDRFDSLFSSINLYKDCLSLFSGKTTENNYIERAETFLNLIDDFKQAGKNIRKIEKFVKKNLDKAGNLKRFVEDLEIEKEKASINSKDMERQIRDFNEFYNNSIVDKYKDILNIAQKLKDEYFSLMKAKNDEMAQVHEILENKALALISEIEKYPGELNRENRVKAENILKYARQRINKKLELGKSIQCKNSKMSLSEMQSSIALIPSKETEIALIQAAIVKEKTDPDIVKPKPPRKISLDISKKMTVKAYRDVLDSQLQNLNGLDDNEIVEIMF